MAFSDTGMISSGALFQKIVLAVGGAAIITIGAWTADTLRELTREVQALRYSMSSLSAKVDGMPPRDLVLRIELLERETKEMEQQLNALQRKR